MSDLLLEVGATVADEPDANEDEQGRSTPGLSDYLRADVAFCERCSVGMLDPERIARRLAWMWRSQVWLERAAGPRPDGADE